MSGFDHEALLYADHDEFLRGTVPFLEQGLRAGEPMLVAVEAEKIAAIAAALHRGADQVQFADMARLGANPARIISAWHEFVSARDGGTPVRGIGEPIWAGRSAAELVECQRHESLLNLAFATTPAFRLLCPYDTRALPPAVIDEARCSHPRVVRGVDELPSDAFRGLDAIARPFAAAMPEPPADAECYGFDAERLPFLREVVAAHASLAGVSPRRARDLAFAVNEVTTNSVRHAGGRGVLRMWTDDGAVVCEVGDAGHLDVPLAGRLPPTGESGGWGLWLANQLCDLVQLRSYPAGTAVRLHMHRP
jgi:anti-sigma regulatory factor (Ser/Thr protein kinase)